MRRCGDAGLLSLKLQSLWRRRANVGEIQDKSEAVEAQAMETCKRMLDEGHPSFTDSAILS